jgi:hypothetical protein
MIREIPYGGWQRCLEISNDHLRLIVTLDVGPRILYFGPPDGPNLFKEFPEQAGVLQPKVPKPDSGYWLPWGGHRLWVAPEGNHCYVPDNQPARLETLGEDHVRLTAQDEPEAGWRRGLEINLQSSAARVHVTHHLTALRDLNEAWAPWALSILDVGGVAILPQPPMGPHPENLLPNRNLVLWAYTSLQDPRLNLGDAEWQVRQDPTRGPLKIGLHHRGGPVGYLNKGWLFTTTVPSVEGATYPDFGVNCEIFTNESILEVETLAPLTRLRAGESVEHAVEWTLEARPGSP